MFLLVVVNFDTLNKFVYNGWSKMFHLCEFHKTFDFRIGKCRFVNIVAGTDRRFARHNLADEFLLVLQGLPQVRIKSRLSHIAVDVDFGIRCALRLGQLCWPATLAARKVFFATYTPPQKTNFTLFAALRRRELCETFLLMPYNRKASPTKSGWPFCYAAGRAGLFSSLMSAEPMISTAPRMPSALSRSCNTSADSSSAHTGSM